jgi:Ion channel
MIQALLFSLVLTATCVLLHYEVLRYLNDRLPRIGFVSERPKVVLALFGAFGSHIAQIALFGLAFFTLHHTFGLGMLGGNFADRYSSYFYFSAETYTSLGFGDIYPAGEIRILAGLEALTGLLMISWSASFSYLEMRRFW